jgi:hypothetical protein
LNLDPLIYIEIQTVHQGRKRVFQENWIEPLSAKEEITVACGLATLRMEAPDLATTIQGIAEARRRLSGRGE